jgi:putative ABC transport system permease protein
MKYWLIAKQSIRGITSNKVRSFLTILGIVIGIGSVIALTSVVAGVKANITGQINKLGTNKLTVSSGKNRFTNQSQSSQSGQKGSFMPPQQDQNQSSFNVGQAATLTENDLKSLMDKKAHPNIKNVSGSISGTSIIDTAGGEQSFQVSGTPDTVFEVQGLTVNKGRLFNNQDLNSNARIAVMGSQAAADAFGTKDPIGKNIKIGSQNYLIIGTLVEKNDSTILNPNSNIYVPYTSLTTDAGASKFGNFTVVAVNDSVVDSVKTDIENTLLKNHGLTDINKADFSVMSSKDLLSTVSSVTGILSALLGGIAGISLLVGGIGIMNIMLVSVTERTREIGLRKAVGAKTRDILTQFLIEAVALTIIGGFVGIIFGFLLGQVISKLINVSPVITTSSIVLAVGVSAVVGIIFGLYPAAKASSMSPIDALRYE